MREAREKDITLHGVDGEVLAAFIRFLYTCHCSIAPEKLVGLCAMADQYDVTLLQQLCMDAIRMHASNHRYVSGGVGFCHHCTAVAAAESSVCMAVMRMHASNHS